MVVAVPVAALLLVGTMMARQAQREDNPAVVVKATNPVISLPDTTADTLAPSVLSTAAPTTAPAATTTSLAARTMFSLGTALPSFPMTANAWVLEPSPTTQSIRERAAAALRTSDPSLFTLTATTWRYEVPATTMPVPFLCTKLDLNDPRSFPRCQDAMRTAQAAWHGGDRAVADATALWERMGYDLRDYQVQPSLDADGYAVAHLLLGGQPVRFGLRVRFEDGHVQVAEGLTATPRAVTAVVVSTAEAVASLASDGFVEWRDEEGGIDTAGGAGPARATIVDAEPALVGVDGAGTDERLYAVPGFAFVAADGTRFVVPALAAAPAWDATPTETTVGG